jgi:type I restriction enzyme S subunit
MDAQQFLAEFGHIANAPGGVARLRELVLTLAVQGLLVQQQSDEPASALIERIRSEKDELVRQGVLKRGKVIAPIKREDFPHSVPRVCSQYLICVYILNFGCCTWIGRC